MACGTPVVGASEMALEETIKNARTGYLYESGNIDDLSRKIDLAYANRKKLSKLCLKEVSKHSADKTIEKVLLMYESQIQKSAEMKNKGSKLSIAKSKVNNILRRRKQKEIDA
jgi:glycosyltransferase involved in cell wall biosynthesis